MPGRKTPLAWLNLMHDKRRFALSLAGVAFAVILMCIEIGFWNALFDSTVIVLEDVKTDFIISSKMQYTLTVQEPFPRRRLWQAQAIAGVRAAYPLYIEFPRAVWRNAADGSTRAIRVLAFHPGDDVFQNPEIASQAGQLTGNDQVLMDRRSKRFYGPKHVGVATELAGRAVTIAGDFDLGTDFAHDGNVIMGDEAFARYFPRGPNPEAALARVELGLVQLEPGADREHVLEALRRTLPDDVDIRTKEAFIEKEKDFWRRSSPIGFVFGLGTAMGFVVGVIICYQILATDVADNLAEYATLKAIGYANRYLSGLVLRQALLMGFLGFIPGVLFSLGLYAILDSITGLPMNLTLLRGGLILLLTLLMCMTSGLIAVRKVQAADPAEVYA